MGSPAQAQELKLASGAVTVQTPNWGENCGPTPASERDAPGLVYRHVKGGARDGDIIPVKKGRLLFGKGVCTQATGQPGIKETRSGRRILCATPANSAGRVSGKVTKTIGADGAVSVTHHFDSEWRLKGTHCRLSRRGRWTFSNKIAKPKAASPKPACGRPGPIVRLVRLDPPNLSVERGGSKQLRVRAVDSNGCRVNTPVNWRVSAGEISAQGIVTTAGLSRGKRIEAVATAGKAKALFVITVGAVDDPLPAIAPFSPSAGPPNPIKYGAEISVDSGNGSHGPAGVLFIVGFITLFAGVFGTLILKRRRSE